MKNNNNLMEIYINTASIRKIYYAELLVIHIEFPYGLNWIVAGSCTAADKRKKAESE